METRGGDSAFRRIVSARLPREERTRRRMAATTAAAVFVACLLVVLGLGLVVQIAIATAATLAVVQIARVHGGGVRELAAHLRTRLRMIRRPAPPVGRADAPELTVAADEMATVEMAAVIAGEDRTVYGRAPLPTRRQLAHALPRVIVPMQRRVSDALSARSAKVELSPSSLQIEGSRCNALGVTLRRAGRAQHAATLHQAARLIFAGVGDRRGEALTANALGAALVEVGKPDAALEQFEQARTLLRALGDQHVEGKVLANIALAKRRAGDDEEAVDLLRSALEKLSPQSEAYRRVERQLRHAN